MAKISARGAHEIERHTARHNVQYLLRSDNVILRKITPDSGWTIVRNTKMATHDLWAAIKRM